MLRKSVVALFLTIVFTTDVSITADEELAVKIERNVPVPMRDGTILRADVSRPDRGGPYPVLVSRTPYNKKGRRFDRYVRAGYIVVCQDARGRFQSDGKWESFVRFNTHDAVDGYDTVEWAARLKGSNGKVGTFGSSYGGFLQWRLASLRPPSLVAMAAQTIPARYTDLEGPGTIRPGRRLKWWISSMTPDLRKRADRPGDHSKSAALEKWNNGGYDTWMQFLPWMDLPQQAFEEETEPVQHWLKNPHLDPWKLHRDAANTAVPNFDVVGWYDHCNGDMQMFKSIVKSANTTLARNQSRIVIGPWSHSGRGKTGYGNIRFGPHAAYDLTAAQIRWFDYWLKGKKNGIEKDSPVRIFVMGDNQWRDEQEWPLSRAKKKTLFLSSEGKANTPNGNGLLDAKSDDPGSDTYIYDPKNPVPALHGPALFTIPTDQRPLAKREDILVYQTEPLSERIEVTGNPVVELFASSSAPDTDFFVRLIDVAPNGIARDVSLGMVRARYRNGLSKPELIEPGKVVKYTIRMNPTSNAFLSGHRIRLDITSSDFPNYDRNHNTPADQNADAKLVKATQTIHHGGLTKTKIILPWIADE
jgi:putative CocE/NonD family hydrolase